MKYEISYSYLLNVSKAGVFAKTPKTQERKMAAKESH